MLFRMGRIDAESEADAAPQDRLPDANEGNNKVLGKFIRMGFSKEEFVALMGSHTLGFAHEDRTGFKGRWTQNPHVFDNTYYKEVLLGDKTKFLRTPVEVYLGEDRQLRTLCESFAQDQALFFDSYARAHVKMSELG